MSGPCYGRNQRRFHMAQTGNHKGLTFGIFLAPFHRVGENPTLGMARDMELIEWIDELGFDEAWIGEHHSAGWETIALPEVFMRAALQRTRYIRLGSGVTSLPYHPPLMVANRFVQLDHMSRGRTMMGCGPGALPSDAYMMGIEPSTQRARMEESLSAIMQLLKCEEPVTMKTDWFELKDARLHLAPYSYPHFPIACASTITPSGMIAASAASCSAPTNGRTASRPCAPTSCSRAMSCRASRAPSTPSWARTNGRAPIARTSSGRRLPP